MLPNSFDRRFDLCDIVARRTFIAVTLNTDFFFSRDIEFFIGRFRQRMYSMKQIEIRRRRPDCVLDAGTVLHSRR